MMLMASGLRAASCLLVRRPPSLSTTISAKRSVNTSDWARSPWFAAVMLMLMFSMAGVPPFVGFWAKLAVIQSVLHIDMTWLAVLAVAFSVVGAYYYLRIVKVMYFDEPTERTALQGSGAMRFVLSLNGLAVLVLGLFPGALLALCARVIP